MNPEKYERARIELVEAELRSAQQDLCRAAVQLVDANHTMARELLEQAKHSYELASFHIEKLSPEPVALVDLAETVHRNIDELEQQIKKNSNAL
jgi:predicted DNA-binding transcriptional regulator